MSSLLTKLLVANRGEIASRIFRTCRRMGLDTVAVFTDVDAEAPFVDEADEAVGLGPDPRAYLDVDRLIGAARQVGADAVHPGFGFLAENAGFAEAVTAAGLLWVGPTPEAIARMGSKRAGGGGKGMRVVHGSR
jgi:acetyl/propionyl-CoA carboxylase alpha subunit